MQTNNEQTVKSQKMEALMQVRVLLAYQRATMYEDDITNIFTAYLESERANWREERHHLAFVFGNLIKFFQILDTLPEIDRYRN